MRGRPEKKIGIIGAGPSGLAAAVSAGRLIAGADDLSGWKIDLIEKNEEPGKKLLATGNGKCNITNKNAEDFQVCEDFFKTLGIIFAEEDDGRMYPYSKQAKSVRDTLAAAVRIYGVNIMTGTVIEKIERTKGRDFSGNPDDDFAITDSSGKKSFYDKLIITTGGKAGIQYGSAGEGFRFARSLGLEVRPVLPALVAMTYGKDQPFDLKKLKGVRAEADLTLIIDGKEAAEESGEIQFTDYGISGICTFDLSRFLKSAPRQDGRIIDCSVVIDLLPGVSEKELVSILKNDPPAGLKGMINEKIENLILGSGLDLSTDHREIIKILKNFTVNIDGTKGWKEAQVTSGGVSLDEVDEITMESKKVKNLYFAGEVLDYDGPCGGYNLTWAWVTGIRAGLSALNGIITDDQTV